MGNIEDQPAPIPQPDRVPVWQLVIDDVLRYSASWEAQPHMAELRAIVVGDMRSRDALGRERYGTPLTTGNGRDQLVDAYQELLDGAVYLRAHIEEQGGSLQTPLGVLYVRHLINTLTLRELLCKRAADT